MIKAIAMAYELEGCGAGNEAAEMRRLSAIEQAATALIKCRGRYHAEQNTIALAAALGVKIPVIGSVSSGHEISIDVSTCDHDAGHRIFASVIGWQDGIILAEKVSQNFVDSPATGTQYLASQDPDPARPSAIELQAAEVGIPEPATELINPCKEVGQS